MDSGSVALIITLLLIFANAFFVAVEYAVVRVRPTQLEQLAAAGDSKAAMAVHITRKLDKYISASQLGVTLASLGVGWIGEPVAAALLVKKFPHWFAVTDATVHVIATAMSFAAITFVQVIIGELAPKTLALQRPVPVARWLGQPLHVFYIATMPAIWLINTMGGLVVRLFGLHPHDAHETQHTAEELRLILSRSPGTLDPQLRQMLVRVIDFRRRKARHVMTLATDVVTIRVTQTVQQALQHALESRYTRYPVLDAEGVRVLGFVHIQDLFAVATGVRKTQRLVELMREPIYAQFDTPIDRLRIDMQTRQLHLAIVNAPNGSFAGIVTLEDLLEEIVGEIRDESDVEIPPIARRAEDVVEANGRVLLEDLERETGFAIRPVEPDAETLGGFVQKRLGAMARVGDRAETEDFVIIVTEVQQRRIMRVRVLRKEKEESSETESG